jgi:hypothetical protein
MKYLLNWKYYAYRIYAGLASRYYAYMYRNKLIPSIVCQSAVASLVVLRDYTQMLGEWVFYIEGMKEKYKRDIIVLVQVLLQVASLPSCRW